ncbi:MAG: EF-P lysine aminoacylase GenX [Polyangiaceae bacterium]|nr:EF-P lysine aminoacylase GenX [Polyangiaceae bacterium]
MGGRVVDVRAERAVIADAMAAVEVRFHEELALEPGALIVARGYWDNRRLTHATLLEAVRAPPPRAESEFARLAWRGLGRRLEQRSLALRRIREFFEQERFIEVDTPIRVRAPSLDRHIQAVGAGRAHWLATSPEYAMKRLLTGGLPRIYQLGHCHRAEELGPLHEPEFMMLEWYRAFADVADVMRDTERIVATVLGALTGARHVRLPSGKRVSFEPPFVQTSVREAFRRHAGIRDAAALAADDERRFFELFVERVEPALARSGRPVFLVEFPITQAALARPCPHDPSTAERFELMLGGIELCNGYGELTDSVENARRLRADRAWRMRSRHVRYPLDRRFLAAVAEGLPRSAGNALGVDRLIAIGCGCETIAEVLSVPYRAL